uniref:Vacuolar protein sorting-associated protein 72 homolog n=1 Tax=Trichuris muris TaxID=70415 RepID=A0A5S6QRB9_TRIMR
MSSRPRRENAGGQMKELMAGLEVEEFYASMYGGFVDEVEDSDFSDGEQKETVSSDSDIDSDEEAIVDSGDNYDQGEDDEELEKRKRKHKFRVPVRYKFKEPFAPKGKSPEVTEPIPKRKRIIAPHAPVLHEKHLRKTTLEKSAEAVRRRTDAKRRKRHFTKVRSVALTQKERLDEARITEKLNEQSLKRFCQFQLEEKKKRHERKAEEVLPPYIRFISSFELANPKPADVDQADASLNGNNGETDSKKIVQNSVIFSDDRLFSEMFSSWKKVPKVPEKKKCVIFGTPANYIDPFTQLPFSNVEAYKKLRELYGKTAARVNFEANGDTPKK